jgi:adenylosuccinate lyase
MLTMLVDEGGLSREDAYGIVQRAALRAADERRPLRELVEQDADVAAALSVDQITACFDEKHLLRHVEKVMERLERLEQLEERAHATR